MGRLLITLGLGIIISIILAVITFIVGIVANIILGSLNITSTNFLAKLIVNCSVILFVTVPYSLFVSQRLYILYKEKNLKSFGVLGKPVIAGFLSWIFLNVLVLPYYYLAKKDESSFEINNEGTFDSKTFINGCIIGLVVDLIVGILMSLSI